MLTLTIWELETAAVQRFILYFFLYTPVSNDPELISDMVLVKTLTTWQIEAATIGDNQLKKKIKSPAFLKIDLPLQSFFKHKRQTFTAVSLLNVRICYHRKPQKFHRAPLIG